MITSTTGQTAVRLPPHSTATASDVSTQPMTFQRWAKGQLESAAEVIHGSSVTRSRSGRKRRGLSSWPAAVCSKSPPPLQDGSPPFASSATTDVRICWPETSVFRTQNRPDRRPTNDFLDSTDYAADTNLTDTAASATRVFSAPRGDRSRFLTASVAQRARSFVVDATDVARDATAAASVRLRTRGDTMVRLLALLALAVSCVGCSACGGPGCGGLCGCGGGGCGAGCCDDAAAAAKIRTPAAAAAATVAVATAAAATPVAAANVAANRAAAAARNCGGGGCCVGGCCGTCVAAIARSARMRNCCLFRRGCNGCCDQCSQCGGCSECGPCAADYDYSACNNCGQRPVAAAAAAAAAARRTAAAAASRKAPAAVPRATTSTTSTPARRSARPRTRTTRSAARAISCMSNPPSIGPY